MNEKARARTHGILTTAQVITFSGSENTFVIQMNRSLGLVKFGDGYGVQIKGKGSILFQFKGGKQRLLTEVYYIPALRNNIISCVQLAEGGNKIVINGDHLWMYDSFGTLLIKVKRLPNRLCKALIASCDPVCLLANIIDVAWLWHARLGHVNFSSIKMLAQKEMAIGVPLISKPNKLCKGYLVAKKTRQPILLQTNYHEKEPLELLHADLCGPITPSTLAGNNYFMLIVDDYSRWTWVFVIRLKDQVFGLFKKFKQQVENMSGCRVKTLRTDRGGEFLSNEFTKFCEDEGIQRHVTTPYT
ncbi:unnamed protein product [Cuscuta europaea]|uniref:Integrase catalytic domain-containing protein n=1 Tax=Cuscuta europaea TaxID=41803 RepID=A0A9P0YHJ3_CUSEU|nr:unnamed protein product [Cuscuta europaea]